MVNLAIGGMLLCTALLLLRLVKLSLADRTLRKCWQANAVLLVVVAVLEFYSLLIDPVLIPYLNGVVVPAALSLFALFSVILIRQTIAYLVEINSFNGITVLDPISGVFNRTYIEQRLDTEVARCHRYGSPLAVVAVQICEFQQLNDEYGHQGSAIATSKLAKRLTSLLRETDVVASFGTGRFVLVLPDTPEGNLAGLVERLRSAIDGMVVIDGGAIEESVKIDVVFGASHCELDTRDGHELLLKAFSSATEPAYDYMSEANETPAIDREFYNESGWKGENAA